MAILIAHDRTLHTFYIKGLFEVGLIHVMNSCNKFDRTLEEFAVQRGDFLEIHLEKDKCIFGQLKGDGTLAYGPSSEGDGPTFDSLFDAICKIAEGEAD